MKKIYPFLFVFATPFVLLLMSYSSGSPGGRTGSPGDNGNTCTQCHTGTASTVTGWITTNVPPEGYTPGQTYTLTATGMHTGVVKFGFELTVEDALGTKAGTLQITEPARTKLINNNKAVTHTSNGTTPSGNSISWSMNWVAPEGVQGNIGIYAAFNAANGNGTTSGDVIYKSSTFISPAPPPPALASIVPNQAEQGETFMATITGTNTQFIGTNPVVALSLHVNPSEAITASQVTVISNTQLEADFDIPSDATPGLWDLNVDDLVMTNAFTVIGTTGIDIYVFENARIYPNPANRQFSVENASGSDLILFNSQGEAVLQSKVMSEKFPVNVSQLAPGIYFVRLVSEGSSQTEKLIIR
ncbi:MAG: choice-of-anchor V domain-containing protein [Bacteroidales bacterium]